MNVIPARLRTLPRIDPKVVVWSIVGLGVLIGLASLAQLIPTEHTRSKRVEIPLATVTLGAIIGSTYGLLAVGLVLIYRANRVINFAHGQIGSFAAAFFGILVIRWHVPYWIGFPIALLVAALIGATAETAVIRRLRNAPRLMSVVATLGIGQFLLLLSVVINPTAAVSSTYPEPSFMPVFTVGFLRVTRAYSGMLFLSPLAVIALVIFLRRSRYGLGIRLAADNPEAARMAGIYASRMSSLAWGVAGALSGFSAILAQPTRGFDVGNSFGPQLLLFALAGAAVARMQSLPVALVAGTGLGIVQAVLYWNFANAGLVNVALFAIILCAFFVQRQRGAREDEKGSWAAVQALAPIPEALRRLWLVRNLGSIVGWVALALAIGLPLLTTNQKAITLTGLLAYAIVGLSIGILTGLGGQLTLGQFAVAAVGAAVSIHISSSSGGFLLAFIYAGLAGAAASLLLGLPALRVRGLFLTVTTLAFALVVPSWALEQPWMLSDGKNPLPVTLFGLELDTGKSYYYFGLAILVVTVLLARNVRRSGFGRLLVAIRDNEDNARAFTIPAATVKMQGYLLAGFIAGLGGAMFAHALARVDVNAFPTAASINAVVLTVIGGISLLAGPLLGALFVIGLPAFVPLDSAGLAANTLGQLIIILYMPRGLVQIVAPLRDRLIRFLGARAGISLDQDDEASDATDAAQETAVTRPRLTFPRVHATPVHGERGILLEGIDLRKSFGGVKAVNGVSLSVRKGETVGLIGPNGAGKTTTFELLSGFTRPDTGQVYFDGRNVTWLSPEERGRLGMVRSFQDAALFPTMTVLEAVQLSFERVDRTPFLRSMTGLLGAERRKEQRARELIAAMGLDRYRSKQIQELSTGTRRITELACLIGLQPVLLLLDEPSSGIAQRETEALGSLLRDLKAHLDMTLFVIEHDIPLIMGLSDRIIAMDTGEIVADGTAEVVRTNPRVVEAYLGGGLTAIERSGRLPSSQQPHTNGNRPHVPGLSVTRWKAVVDAFGSVDAIRAATVEDLQRVPGVGARLARRLQEALRQ